MLPIKEDVLNYWLIVSLPWIPAFIWLRPRIKLLKLTGANDNLPFLYLFAAIMAMAVPTILAQEYIQKASGELTNLESINDIDKSAPTKYYTLKNYHIDKKNIEVQTIYEETGRTGEHLNMHFYVVLPILSSEEDKANPSCLAWLGFEYYKQISNRLYDFEKDEEFKKFGDECQKDFDRKNFNQFVYLDRVGNNKDGDAFKEAILKSAKCNPNNTSVFLAVNEPFENRMGNTFAWIFGAFGISGGIWLIMILIPKIDELQLKRFKSGKRYKDKDMIEFINFLKIKEGYFITPIIVYLNLLIFVIMLLSGIDFIYLKGEDLLNWGANFRPYTTYGEWWRLLSSTFLHSGLLHLLANMFGLLFIGIFLEPLLGRTKFLTVYLLTGILASCASLWWHEATISVGASGAIFGLYGIFLALLLTKNFPPDFGPIFLVSTLVFIGYNLLMGTGGGIDNAAHIGGLLSGFVIGLILYPMLKKQVDIEQK
jgi:rhomboid protease GluP